MPGLDVHARYRPAAGGQLGGDWWDLLPLAGDRVAVVVGDVAGHGVHAAAAMAQLRTALRAYLLEGHSPAAALDRSTRGRHPQRQPHGDGGRRIVSPAAEGASGAPSVDLASAGHPAPLLVTAQGAVALQVPTRPMLGLGFGPTSGTVDEVATTPPRGRRAAVLQRRTGRAARDEPVRDDPAARGERRDAVGEGLDVAAVADRLLTAVPGRGDDDTTLVLAARSSPLRVT